MLLFHQTPQNLFKVMPFQKEFQFPSDEELSTDNEVQLSLSALRAGAIHLGKYCEKENNEFMLCKRELGDPRKCLKEGRYVTDCALDFFQKMKENCCEEFNQYAKCLFASSAQMEYKYCRETQAEMDKCILEKMNFERPPFGWQAEVHIHEAERPKPEDKIAHYPDAPDELPKDVELKEPRFGARRYFL